MKHGENKIAQKFNLNKLNILNSQEKNRIF